MVFKWNAQRERELMVLAIDLTGIPDDSKLNKAAAKLGSDLEACRQKLMEMIDQCKNSLEGNDSISSAPAVTTPRSEVGAMKTTPVSRKKKVAATYNEIDETPSKKQKHVDFDKTADQVHDLEANGKSAGQLVVDKA